MIEVLACGPVNSVQDAGRYGYRAQGVSTSGAMDPLSMRAANLLVGNPEGAAALEIQSFPFRAKVRDRCRLAVTGAAAPMTLDGRALPSNWAVTAEPGQVLEIAQPGAGARCYLALAGGIAVPMVLGSSSTHLRSEFGGLEGREIRAGDVLTAGSAPACAGDRVTGGSVADGGGSVSTDGGAVPGAGFISENGEVVQRAGSVREGNGDARTAGAAPACDGGSGCGRSAPRGNACAEGAADRGLMAPLAELGGQPLRLRVIAGADLAMFPEDRQEALWQTDWQISPQSNRSGYRLRGATLTLPEPVSLYSYGVVPGIVQVPPSGEPIIQMADANTAGGYPRIGGVIEADLWKLGQARIGSRLRFERVDFATAAAALDEIDTWLQGARAALRLRG